MASSMLAIVPGALVGALASVGLQAAHSRWVRHRLDKKAAFSGVWYQEILAIGTLPQRIDKVILSQDGPRVFGEFHRQLPATEIGRKWAIYGYIYGNRAVFYFYTITPDYDPSSFGMITLARDPDNKKSQAWFGVYFRPDNEEFADIVNDRMLGRPIAWQRQPKDEIDFVDEVNRSPRALAALGEKWTRTPPGH